MRPQACISIPLEGLDLSRLSLAASSEGAAAGPSDADHLNAAHPKAAAGGTQSGEASFRLTATFKLIPSNPEPEIQLQVRAQACI
jgi:hypothetical protein